MSDRLGLMQRQIMGVPVTRPPTFTPNPAKVDPRAIIAKLKAMLDAEHKARLAAEARLREVLDRVAKMKAPEPAKSKPRLTIVKPIEPSAEKSEAPSAFDVIASMGGDDPEEEGEAS